jgi:hypothetical protein
VISYDRKRPKDIMRRTTKKIRLTLDSLILITTKEKLLNTEKTKKSTLIGVGMVITDATLDRAKRDEKEMDTALKALDHLRPLEKYYQDSTHATFFLKSEFQDAYAKFTNEIHICTACIAYFQEYTLMALATCKDVERWYEKSYLVVE